MYDIQYYSIIFTKVTKTMEGATLTDILGAIVTMLISVVSAATGLDCLGALYSAYKRACIRLEDEKWLLENCRDPTFYSKMKAHPTVCSEVETNARIGAFWTALREVTSVVRVSWQPYLVGFTGAIVVVVILLIILLIILLPVCWVCASRVSSGRVLRRRDRLCNRWGECIPVHDFRSVHKA